MGKSMSEVEQVPTTEAEQPELVDVSQETTVAETGEPPQEGEKTPEEGKPKRSAGIEKRMSELTAKRREAEARAADAERRLAELTSAKPADGGEKEPSLDDFDTYDQFVKAQSRWEAKQAVMSMQRESAEAGRTAANGQRAEVLKAQFQAKVEDARARIPDFEAVAFNPNVPVTEAMQAAILESDMSADVAYYLGKNPDAAFRMTQMSPMSVAREIGRIEATILSTPVVVKATQAPDPIRPVGQRSANVQKDPDEMTDAEYFAWRKSQNSAR